MFSAHSFQRCEQDVLDCLPRCGQCLRGDPDCRPTKDRTSQNFACCSLLGPNSCTVEVGQEYATLARDRLSLP